MDAVTLADYQRDILRTAFRASVARGETRPLLLPACLGPSFLAPTVFIAVAGRHQSLKPWRYPIAVAIAAVNLSLLGSLSGPVTSSPNLASSYAAGLIFSWGTLWAFVLLVWTDPWDGERVARRRAVQPPAEKEGHYRTPGPNLDASDAPDALDAPDEDIARSLQQGHEYYWQSFPVDGSFWERFGWAADLYLAWRGIGWSWCKTPAPHFVPPSRPHTDELVILASIPEVTTYYGFRRHRTRRAFFRARLLAFVVSYLVLDVCAVLMTHDPHYVLGPPPPRLDNLLPWVDKVYRCPVGMPLPPPALAEEIPRYLALLYRYPLVNSLYRSVLGLAGIVAALHLTSSLLQMICVGLSTFLFSPASTSATATALQLWNYPSLFGNLSMLRDRGMAGFWAGCWHQTFRAAFVAPTIWLMDKGILPDDRHLLIVRVVGLSIAFGQSALLHAAGSAASLPDYACWQMPVLFFILSAVGALIQKLLQEKVLDDYLPRSVTRVCNVLFAAVWLHATQWFLIDDLARSGIWLFEPVPFSVVRWLMVRAADGGMIVSPAGSSRAGHAAWRWYHDDLLHWHTGRRWWESGLAI